MATWENLPSTDPNLPPSLVGWYREHGRSFPWRETSNPFAILCAEIMLQRTRAEQVEPTYMAFRDRFSHPSDILKAGRHSIDDHFDRLGLHWRKGYFWSMVNELIRKYDGEVPCGRDELLELPGVGVYSATAVRVFSFGKLETVVDTNVLRIFSRYYGLNLPNHARRSPRVQEWADQHAPSTATECRQFNWGLIDLGAMLCTPSSQADPICPVFEDCAAARSREEQEENS